MHQKFTLVPQTCIVYVNLTSADCLIFLWSWIIKQLLRIISREIVVILKNSYFWHFFLKPRNQ